MRIEVNGEAREVRQGSLNDILAQLGFNDALVATAVNGDFVPKAARVDHQLRQGDRLEVVAPMQGG